MEALLRYQHGLLPQQMRHWLRTVLELDDQTDQQLLISAPKGALTQGLQEQREATTNHQSAPSDGLNAAPAVVAKIV
jgi:hypothetical protein